MRIATVAGFCLGLSMLVMPAKGLDIANGDYSRNDPKLVRIMTWNVYQRLGDPYEADTAWTTTQTGSALAAIGLIVEALDPDVLLLQEVGDIDHGVSYAAALSELQAWRNAYRPGFSVALSSDGGNIHNAIVSRWPFADLNGDGRSLSIDIPFMSYGPDGWPAAGDGGIRGWYQGEINLPDGIYAGDLYVGSSHFKAYSGYDSERIRAAKNIAGYIQYGLNTNDDPYGVIPDAQQPPNALGENTPVIWGGDFNVVDSWTPIDAMRQANPAVANDGTDRLGGVSWRSDSAAAFDGSTHTWGSSSRLDWLFVQDGIATVDAAFVFDTGRMPRNWQNTITQGAPEAFEGLYQNARISAVASDHFPVIVDVALPLAVVLESARISGPETINGGGYGQFQGIAEFSDGSEQIVTTTGSWSVVSGPVSFLNPGLIHADVVGFDTAATLAFSYTAEGVTVGSQKTFSVLAVCDRGDVNGDGDLDGEDIQAFIDAMLGVETDPGTVCRANVVVDDAIDGLDALAFVGMLVN